MAAIIPDDWDGVTFECKRVIWPSSKKWAAILLGQMSEPSVIDYWDENTGDATDAFVAVQNAYRQTIPDIYNLECDDLSNLPISAFKAEIEGDQLISLQTWTEIFWDTLDYNHNDPGFILGGDGHKPATEDKEGLWHYDASLQVAVDTGVWFARAIVWETTQILANSQGQGLFIDLSFDHVWGSSDQTLKIQVWGTAALTIADTPSNTWFSGHYVGPVVAS